MANFATLTKYDESRAPFLGSSILTTGTEDFYGKKIEKMGRRWVWRFERFDHRGTQVSSFMYVTEVLKALESGSLEVYRK